MAEDWQNAEIVDWENRMMDEGNSPCGDKSGSDSIEIPFAMPSARVRKLKDGSFGARPGGAEAGPGTLSVMMEDTLTDFMKIRKWVRERIQDMLLDIAAGRCKDKTFCWRKICDLKDFTIVTIAEHEPYNANPPASWQADGPGDMDDLVYCKYSARIMWLCGCKTEAEINDPWGIHR